MTSTIATTTTGSSAASATPTAICSSNLYDTPSQDRVCAMPYGGNRTRADMMRRCCGDADVVAYYDDCGVYCLALGQSVKDLQTCLFDEGAGWSDVFCRDNGDVNASATATGNARPEASARASVIIGGGDDDDDDDDGESGSTSGSGSGGGAESTSSPNAVARGATPPPGVSLLGLGVGALLLFSGAMFGALQI